MKDLLLPDHHAIRSSLHAAHHRHRPNHISSIQVGSTKTDAALAYATTLWSSALRDYETDSTSRFAEALAYLDAIEHSDLHTATRFEDIA